MEIPLPLEILRQILWEMVGLLPLDEVLRARHVNSFFDQEITAMLIDDESAGCQECGNSRFREWVRLPRLFKVGCLRRKMEMHAQKPCILSMWIEEMLDGEEKRGNITTKENRDAVREKLVHGAATGAFSPHLLLCPGPGVTECLIRYNYQLGQQDTIIREPLDKTFKLLMMCSAVRRGDAAELDEFLSKGWDPADYTNRFGRVPLDVAARKGNGDIIRVLLKHTPVHFGRRSLTYYYNYNSMDMWNVAARAGNKEALDALIEDVKANNNGRVGTRLAGCIEAVARIGKLPMVQYLLDKCTRDFELLRHRALIAAIRSSEMAVIEWAVRQDGGVDDYEPRNLWEQYKGLLYEALTGGGRKRRPDIVKLLLESGVDPNKTYPSLSRTVFQTALFAHDTKSAMILLEYGADLTTKSLPAGSAGKRMVPPLFWTHKEGNAAMFHAMLDKGVSKTLRHKGKRYTISREPECIHRVERIFEDLGWDEAEVQAADIDYLMIQTG